MRLFVIRLKARRCIFLPKYFGASYTRPFWISQNFLTKTSLIRRIVKIARLGKDDHVVEIGAGKGHITKELAAVCGEVTAVEIDRVLFNKLSERFEKHSNLRLVCCDFLHWNLPKTPYKVFANIPFSKTTEIIRKLTLCRDMPEDVWLVMEKGAAKRFLGKPHETSASLRIKPFFESSIEFYFQRSDFHPSPSVDTVLLHLKKKAVPDIPKHQYPVYDRFLKQCWCNPDGIRGLLTKRQITKALQAEGLSCDLLTGEMKYIQWLCLFRCYLKFGMHAK